MDKWDILFSKKVYCGRCMMRFKGIKFKAFLNIIVKGWGV